MKFKVGDKVTINTKVYGIVDIPWDTVFTIEHVKTEIGKYPYGIKSLDGKYELEYVLETELILYEKAPFKVGDKVQLKNKASYNNAWSEVMTIVSLQLESDYFCDHYSASSLENKKTGSFRESELQLVTNEFNNEYSIYNRSNAEFVKVCINTEQEAIDYVNKLTNSGTYIILKATKMITIEKAKPKITVKNYTYEP